MEEATSKALEKLATAVAEAVYDGDWRADLVTREIATADSKADALGRLEKLREEVDSAIEIVKRAR